jgi:hypothetical protein
MADQPSVVSGYISIILRAIEETHDDPAQLRRLIYDIARTSLGKLVLSNYRQIGSAGLQELVLDLETAIKQVERLSQKPNELPASDLNLELIEGPVKPLGHTSITILDQPRKPRFDDDPWHNNSLLIRPPSAEIYRERRPLPEFLKPETIWEPINGQGPKGDWKGRWWKFELLLAALVGVAIYATILVQSDYFRGRVLSRPDENAQGVAVAAIPHASQLGSALSNKANSANGAPAPDFPLPTVYGVFAVSAGKLYELEPLPIRVPDSRVGISAMITSPSAVSVPSGKLDFVIFRRDLVSNAPEEVFIRVVARVTREMRFSGTGPPAITKVNDQWAIRSKSYELRVAPVSDNQEMIVLRPENGQFSLTPGRYALVIKGLGYDFSVDGQMTDTAQCLERTNAVDQTVYSECRSTP